MTFSARDDRLSLVERGIEVLDVFSFGVQSAEVAEVAEVVGFGRLALPRVVGPHPL